MRLRSLAGSLTAVAMLAAPVAASAASVANPAAKLSVAGSRATAPTKATNKALGGGGAIAALIVAGVVAIGVIAIVKDDDSDSN